MLMGSPKHSRASESSFSLAAKLVGRGTMRSMVEELRAGARPLHHSLFGEWFPSPAFGQGGIQSRLTVNPAKLWLTGISSIVLTLRCGGRFATHHIASAMSVAVIGCAPA